MLEYVNDGGDKFHGQHIRTKGIPAACIRYFAEQHNRAVLDLYKKVYGNKTIKFDFTNDGNRFV